MAEGEIIALTVNIRYKQGYTGRLVGQCREFPFIIVEGRTLAELKDIVSDDLDAFFKTFPKDAESILKEYGKVLNEKQDQETKDNEGWNQNRIELKIPVTK